MARFLLSATLFAAALGSAAGATAATYAAKPAVPVAQHRIIARDISWACGPASCLGNTEESRPLVLCQNLAKKAGRIESFVVNGRAFAAAELDKCNKFAPAGGDTAIARAN